MKISNVDTEIWKPEKEQEIKNNENQYGQKYQIN